MSGFMNFLNGKKTYLTLAAGLIYDLVNYLDGKVTVEAAIQVALGLAAGVFLRSAMPVK